MNRAFITGGSGFLGGRIIRDLRSHDIEVAALARSDHAAATVAALGATVVRGDLGDPGALEAGMRGCDVVFHAAAYVADHGPLEEFMRVTVTGTEDVLSAARTTGVKRVVHVSTEAVLADGKPIVRADETRSRPSRPIGPYPLTKGLAEERVLAANKDGLETVIVRPRFIWGAGDPNLTSKIAESVKAGRFAWISGGHYATSTCHVDNAAEGAILAAERGKPGEIYFLTDGEPVDFRDFMTAVLQARGVDPGTRSVPRWAAKMLASLTGWMKRPPVTRTAVALVGHEVTVVDAKARKELGYTSHVTREWGLAQMRAAMAGADSASSDVAPGPRPGS